MMISIITLTLLSLLYKFFVKRRNNLYDKGIKPSVKFDIPVICIGNISVGGTGKTPHTEYLIRLLKEDYRLAVLSRGYKRKTKGFVLAEENTTTQEIGDEPLQMHRKFPEITVAVQEKRKYGINHILKLFPKTEIILLDDAFQHRQVTPSLSIVLVDYNRPVYEDKLLPLGRLREPVEGLARADIVIVSKCTRNISDKQQQEIKQQLNLNERQQLYFSSIAYDRLNAAFPNKASCQQIEIASLQQNPRPMLGFCGIASPAPFVKWLKELDPKAKVLRFSDHHTYSRKDIAKIKQGFKSIRDKNGIIVTTEKDYFHICNHPDFEDLTPYIYYVTLKVDFLNDQTSLFNHQIIEHVRSYQPNDILAKRKHSRFGRNRRYIRFRAKQSRRPN